MPIDRPASGDQPADHDERREMQPSSWRWDSIGRGERPPPPEDILAARAYDERLKAAKHAQLGDAPADDQNAQQDADDESESWPRFGDHRDQGVTDEKVKAAYERMVQLEGTPETQAAQEIEWERAAFEKYGPPARALSGAEVREFGQRIRAQHVTDTNSPDETNEARVRYSSPEVPSRPLEMPAKHRADLGDETHDHEPDDEPSERSTDAERLQERRDRADGMRDEVDLGEKVRGLPNARDVLPNLNWAEIDHRGKFEGYAMNPEHPDNRKKADAWWALGYEVDDPDGRREAAQDIRDLIHHELLKDGKVTEVRESDYGPRYTVMNGFIGRNGRYATLVTCWQVDNPGERGHPRLLTSWVELHQDEENDQ